MEPYGTAHMTALVATVVLGVLLVVAARRLRSSNVGGSRREELALTAAGWIMLILTLVWMGWNMLPLNWNIDQSLPFHLSDALRIVTSIALLTRSGWAIAISYFWGLTLNLQSIITPDLNYFHAPAVEYFAYWFLHIAALLTPVVFVWGFGYRPTWRGYGVTFVVTAAWAGVAAIANGLTGANYMYLARAPEGPSILDLLGPWPIYLLWEAVVIAAVWALITWPWTSTRLRGTRVGQLGLVSRTSRRETSTLAAR